MMPFELFPTFIAYIHDLYNIKSKIDKLLFLKTFCKWQGICIVIFEIILHEK
jgi:hypothetical protein